MSGLKSEVVRGDRFGIGNEGSRRSGVAFACELFRCTKCMRTGCGAFSSVIAVRNCGIVLFSVCSRSRQL